MKTALDLCDARVSHLEFAEGVTSLRFSYACIRRASGRPGADSEWSQEAVLILADAQVRGPMPRLPGTITDGFLELGGIRHALIPLPFKRRGGARLELEFADGGRLELVGERPCIELLGPPIRLDESR